MAKRRFEWGGGGRRFERARGGVVEYWEISRVGIRCGTAWGRKGGGHRGIKCITQVDEAHARRHLERAVRKKLREGYVEVAPPRRYKTGKADDRVFDRIKLADEYLPVTGRREVYLDSCPWQQTGGRRDEYLLLRDEGRSAVSFLVLDGVARPDDVTAFLDFLDTRRDLAFDGRSHHKIALPAPVGRFTHALFCWPALGYFGPSGRIAQAFPIFDCEIGDADTEALVEARIKGDDPIPHSTLKRSPHPVIDLRFDLRPHKAETFKDYWGPPPREVGMFKCYPRSSLDKMVELLAQATPDSYVEIRSFRGDIKTLRPRDLTRKAAAEINRFLLGQVQ